ncbi:uncharacterized protein LOC102716362 [Oryza brachyantha]|uniref:DUF4408 domain-containing protein n=1 Tax=Oryza brachyantha TaxID=4533 RepID=J3NDA1_ORYBR|nr:uncharacterized protein LOC102716362 [Oryza brachyantha]
MEGGPASLAVLRAALLGMAVVLSMVTWVPHVYSCARIFLLVSLPSAASTLATPRCLFVFSNIIVIFLANESKLSESEGESFTDDAIGFRVGAFTPPATTTQENDVAEEEENMSEEQEDGMAILHDDHASLQQRQRDEPEDVDAASSILVAEEPGGEDDVVHLCDAETEEGEAVSSQDEMMMMMMMEEEATEEEDAGLPTDELNRRVEDFIARFNMERQLEARMLVCCC